MQPTLRFQRQATHFLGLLHALFDKGTTGGWVSGKRVDQPLVARRFDDGGIW